MYPDPRAFRPERFLSADGTALDLAGTLDPREVAFGFGRRVCPGRHMAADSIWLTVAAALACLDIGKAKDERGREIEVREEFKSGFVV